MLRFTVGTFLVYYILAISNYEFRTGVFNVCRGVGVNEIPHIEFLTCLARSVPHNR